MDEHNTPDDVRATLMAHLAEGFNKTLYDSPNGLSHAVRFAAGEVAFVVTVEGFQVVDRRTAPGDN